MRITKNTLKKLIKEELQELQSLPPEGGMTDDPSAEPMGQTQAGLEDVIDQELLEDLMGALQEFLTRGIFDPARKAPGAKAEYQEIRKLARKLKLRLGSIYNVGPSRPSGHDYRRMERGVRLEGR